MERSAEEFMREAIGLARANVEAGGPLCQRSCRMS